MSNKNWKPFKFNILDRHRESSGKTRAKGVAMGGRGGVTRKQLLAKLAERLKVKLERKRKEAL